MKITELSNSGSNAMQPCKVVEEFAKNPDYMDFLKKFDFTTTDEIVSGYKYLAKSVYFDEYCRSKVNRDKLPSIALIYKQMSALLTSANPYKHYTAIAETLYLDHFEPKIMEQNFAKFYSKKPDKSKYDAAVKKMVEWWKLTPEDIDILRYFVCQSKAGKDFKSKLQRIVYIWSDAKNTGKTTIAELFTLALNGETDLNNVKNYKSKIPREWQFGRFDVPVALNKRCVLLDEGFGGKSGTDNYYQAIKSEMTANDCTIEVKNGGFFSKWCYRNYIITSNFAPSKFIYDKSERRVSVINLENKPPKLKEEVIFEVIKDFCQNAEPEADFFDWYHETMPDVMGSTGVIEEEIGHAFLSDDFFKMLKGFEAAFKQKVYFPSEFKKWAFNEAGIVKTDKNSMHIAPAVISIFGEPKELKGGQKYYRTSALIEVISENASGEDSEIEIKNVEPMPF